MAAVDRFVVDVPQHALDELRRRLRATQWPPVIGDDDWAAGVQVSYLRGLVDYWSTDFDWRKQERAINAYPHRRVEIHGVPIHFMHIRGHGPAPTPLLLTHGWPWTFWDFAALIGPLTDPARHGGDASDACDLVIPSLPGTCFSNPLPRPVGVVETAEIWLELMRDVLDYERFAAHGGDWGAVISGLLGHMAPDAVLGVHLSTATVPSVAWRDLTIDDYLPDERARWDRMQAAAGVVTSHVAVQSHDPQTLAFALADSPAGLAAWIIDRRRNGSDCGGDIERSFTRDEILTLVMLYWASESIAGSMRYYHESFRQIPWGSAADLPYIRSPTAFATGPADIVYIPRRVAERHANVVRWTELPRGGHFLAAEQPALVVDDLRAFLRVVRRPPA